MTEQLRLTDEEMNTAIDTWLSDWDDHRNRNQVIADASTAKAVRWMANRLDGMGLDAARNVLLLQAHKEGWEVTSG